jgi:dihydroneopterin aldolase
MTSSNRDRGPRLSRRESLLFEAGIKLGGVFHQYLGIPVSDQTAASLARAVEAAVGLQPFVRRVTVRIDPKRGGPLGKGRFAYRYLTPEMLEVSVRLVDGPTAVEARLQHRPDLRYPLMKVVRMDDPERRAPRAARAARRARVLSPRSRHRPPG